ncbi:hypothetical protein Tco_0579382 [Tanacetum coccineum]
MLEELVTLLWRFEDCDHARVPQVKIYFGKACPASRCGDEYGVGEARWVGHGYGMCPTWLGDDTIVSMDNCETTDWVWLVLDGAWVGGEERGVKDRRRGGRKRKVGVIKGAVRSHSQDGLGTTACYARRYGDLYTIEAYSSHWYRAERYLVRVPVFFASVCAVSINCGSLLSPFIELTPVYPDEERYERVGGGRGYRKKREIIGKNVEGKWTRVQTPPIPFTQRLRKEKEEAQQKKFLENLKQLHINLPFIEALAQMPKYAKFLKGLLTNRARLEEACTITMNERCSAVLLNKLPLKEKDPGSFTIPCDIGQLHINNALADQEATLLVSRVSITVGIKSLLSAVEVTAASYDLLPVQNVTTARRVSAVTLS